MENSDIMIDKQDAAHRRIQKGEKGKQSNTGRGLALDTTKNMKAERKPLAVAWKSPSFTPCGAVAKH